MAQARNGVITCRDSYFSYNFMWAIHEMSLVSFPRWWKCVFEVALLLCFTQLLGPAHYSYTSSVWANW